jgi:hypothetical protein
MSSSSSKFFPVTVNYSQKGKYSYEGTVVRFYDFPLSKQSLGAERLDLNCFWFCCGKNPENRIGGAWLLAPGDRVLAFLPQVREKHVYFNTKEHKSYARLFFVEEKNADTSMDLRSPLPELKVRIALTNEKRGMNDLFLLASCSGELFDFSEQLDVEDRVLLWKWLNGNEEGWGSRERWNPLGAARWVASRFPNPSKSLGFGAGAGSVNGWVGGQKRKAPQPQHIAAPTPQYFQNSQPFSIPNEMKAPPLAPMDQAFSPPASPRAHSPVYEPTTANIYDPCAV